MIFLLSFLTLNTLVAEDFSQDYQQAGQFEVNESIGQWQDPTRNNRIVAWRLYRPVASQAKTPCVIYSHGIGGTRSGNAHLGRHLASHGIAALHLQHVGSDRVAFRKRPRAMATLVNDPQAAVDRFIDIRFAVKQLKAVSQEDGRFKNIDVNSLGISGHSLGGLTTQIIAGQKVSGFGQTLAVPEFKGAFVLSPSPPRQGYGSANDAFASMMMPVFHATGTRDDFPDKKFATSDRATPFNKISNVDQWLLVIQDASHFTLSGNDKMPRFAKFVRGMGADPNLTRNHNYLKAASLAFWQTVLLDDQKAQDFLANGKFETLIGKNGTFKSKRRSRQNDE